jgi:DNA-binding NarL/FixJ family response regulator
MHGQEINAHRGAIVISIDAARERRADRRRLWAEPVRVLAAGGHALTRAALRRLLAEVPGIAVTGDGRPDVVLLDVGAGGGAAAAVARIARDPATAGSSILLLAEPDWRGVLPVPAHGPVSKDASPAELVAALRTLAAG